MSWEVQQPYFRGLNMRDLKIDEAYVNVSWTGDGDMFLYKRSENCYLCPWERVDKVSGSMVLKESTHHLMHFLGRRSGEEEFIRTDCSPEELNQICSVTERLGEFGVYDLNMRDCSFETALEPVNENLAILVCFLSLVGLALLNLGIKLIPGKPAHKVERWLGWRSEKQEGGGGKQRLRSLDTLRGIALALMMFVNDGGGGYYFFEHATWNGLYVADLVFPWFLWIMGVCIPMSVRSNQKRKVPLKTVIWTITVRSVKLFMLGFILNSSGWIDLERLRVPGVLQRFAISYFVAAIIGNLFSKQRTDEPGWFSDILHLVPHWLVVLGLMLIHQLVVWLVPAPGCPQGYRGPGGLHDWSPERNYSDCIGGITGYIDKEFFGVSHIYGNPTAKEVYGATAFDPEGLFGSIPTILQVWFGYQAGYTLQVYSDHKHRVSRWMIWSVVTGALGAGLCGASQNEGWMPINKNLWSVSYVLVTSCFAFFLLTVLYLLIDVKQWWKGQPFFFAGMNSILLYCGHQIGWMIFPWHFAIGSMNTHAARLPEALWGASLWVLISFVLYKKKVFVTV